MPSKLNGEKDGKDEGQSQKPDLGSLDGLIEKIARVPKKELDRLLEEEAGRKRKKKGN